LQCIVTVPFQIQNSQFLYLSNYQAFLDKMGSAGEPKEYRLPWIQTPLIESSTLSRAAGCRIFLKLENLQPSASFKSRGIGNLILQQVAHHSHASPARNLHFFSSSGGNAGIACVTAARSLGYPASVVVPDSTDAAFIAKIRAAGASDVIQHGSSWKFADKYLRSEVIPKAERSGEVGIYVPPFDHEDVWQGASTMVEEIQKQMPDSERPDAIVCSVGGGGLFSGIMQGLDRVGWSTGDDAVKVLAMETDGAHSLQYSLKKGKLSEMDKITSIAKSLGAVQVCEDAFTKAQRPNVRSVVLSDAEACMGCWRLADDERILVEPACGVSVALAYDGRLMQLMKGLTQETKVVIVVCGGSGVTLDKLAEWRKTYGPAVEGLVPQTLDEVVPSSHSLP
jgi:L-serine/L-threonine ammonia-lyase